MRSRLAEWIRVLQMDLEERYGPRRSGAGAALRQLQQAFVRAAKQRPDLRKYSFGGFSVETLRDTEVPLAMEVSRKVIELGGPGSGVLQEGLLESLAYTGSPQSVAFLRELVDLRPPRDKFTAVRRRLAVEGLAMTLLRHRSETALTALLELLTRPEDQVRVHVMNSLRLVLEELGGELTADVEKALQNAVVSDSALPVRFEASCLLAAFDREQLEQELSGAVDFQVTLDRNGTCRRVVRVAKEGLLWDLHRGIQEAFGWDDDHLYSFFLNGVDDRSFELKGPTPMGDFVDPGDEEAGDPVIGLLGFRKGDRFDYLFDYGDQHLFHIEVLAVDTAEPQDGVFSVIERVGRAPRQYKNW